MILGFFQLGGTGEFCGKIHIEVKPAGVFGYFAGITAILAQIQFLEKIVPLIVDHNKCGKIFDFYAPNRFHSQFRIFQHLDEIGRASCRERV